MTSSLALPATCSVALHGPAPQLQGSGEVIQGNSSSAPFISQQGSTGRCLVEGDTQIILRRGIFDFYKAGFEYERDNFRMVHVSAPSNIDDLILEAVRDCQDIKVITFFSACDSSDGGSDTEEVEYEDDA